MILGECLGGDLKLRRRSESVPPNFFLIQFGRRSYQFQAHGPRISVTAHFSYFSVFTDYGIVQLTGPDSGSQLLIWLKPNCSDWREKQGNECKQEPVIAVANLAMRCLKKTGKKESDRCKRRFCSVGEDLFVCRGILGDWECKLDIAPASPCSTLFFFTKIRSYT